MAYSLRQCAVNLPSKFGNRQNLGDYLPGTMTATSVILADNSLAMKALIQGIQQLTETFEFEELKYQTPVPPATALSMNMGNPVIPIEGLLATIEGNTNYPQFQDQNIVDITDIYTFWVWFANSPSVSGRTLKYRRITTIDTYSYGITSNSQGTIGVAPPVYYSRFGNVLQVGPAPDQTYQYFVRVKLRHPFPVPYPNAGTNPNKSGQQLSNFIPAQLTAETFIGGVPAGVSVIDGGQGYESNAVSIPLVWDPPPPGGVAPTGYVALADVNGVVNGYSGGTPGSGYVTKPNAYTAMQSTQEVFMPDSWQQAVEYMACYNLALWEGAQEYISMFTEKLMALGIDIKVLRLRPQMERDEMHNERMFSSRVAKYTFS